MADESIEAFLQLLQASEDGEVEEAEAPVTGPATSTVKQIRDWGEKGYKAAKELEKENKALRAFKAEVEKVERERTISKTFEDLKLSPKVADLYTGDPEEAAIRQWALDHDLVEAASPEETTEEKSQGFVPGGETKALDLGPTMIGREEYMRLLAENPARLGQLIDQGRVALETSD